MNHNIERLKAEIARAESLPEDERLRQYGTEGLELLRSALRSYDGLLETTYVNYDPIDD